MKRVLKVKKYIRYVDDMIFILPSKKDAEDVLAKCERYLNDRLHLELSRYRIAPVKDGANFVGFRTKKEKRVLRRRSIVNFKRALRKGNVDSISSILGHALNTSSYEPFLNLALDLLSVEDVRRLPERFRSDMAKQIIATNKRP